MKILLACHISSFNEVVEWLKARPGVDLIDSYRIEYIEDALKEDGPFDLVLSSGAGRRIGSGDDPIEDFNAPEEYAMRNNVPHIPLYNIMGDRRSQKSIIRSASRLILS